VTRATFRIPTPLTKITQTQNRINNTMAAIASMLPYAQRLGQVYNGLKVVGGATAAYAGAKAVYKGGKRGARYVMGGPRKKVAKSAKAHPASGTGATAGYAGPMGNRRKSGRRAPAKRRRTVRKRKRAPARGENFFARNGSTSTLETSGTISDPDCVYLGHSSVVPEECFMNYMRALTRRLYKIATGWEADNVNAVIPYKTVGGAQLGNGHTIILKYVTNLGFNTKAEEITPVTDPSATIDMVAGMIKWRFLDVSSNNDIWKNRRLLWIQIVDDGTGFTRAHIDLQTVKVSVYTKSELKIQNVTIPSEGATSEDHVSNVPLVGRAYHFSSWQPKLTDDDNSYLTVGNQATGMVTWRANQSSGIQYQTWREPPQSAAFTNCSGMAVVRMEPGTIRNHVSMCRKTLGLDQFLLALSLNSNLAANRTPRLGGHELFAMERLIQLAGALPIKCVYEVNNFTGVSITSKKKTTMMQKVASTTQNSEP